MDGDVRRSTMIDILTQSQQPLSGSVLAKKLGVSRQIIVQDIALLRATNKNILSTNKGYILFHQDANYGKVTRTMKVKHSEEQILDELNTIVDFGGKVLDVVVEHPIYGQIMVDLIINSRADAKTFVDDVKKHKTKPLNELTQGVHYHTIVADGLDIIQTIENELFKKGYLIK